MVSIRDVAKHAGVAISTVSKVLNNYPNVSEATKKKVNAAVRELNFVPNTVAAALSSKQAGRVAILLNIDRKTSVVDEINMQYLTGVINQAEEMGLDIITVFFSMIRNKSVDEMITYFKVQSISGIVIFGLTQKDTVLQSLIESEEFKVVVVDAPFVNEHTTSIGIDHKKAQYEIAKLMIEKNMEQNEKSSSILYIAGKRDAYVTDLRVEAMQQLAKELDITLLVRDGEYSELMARNITFKYADNKDIIVCGSDLMAIGAMKALIDMDIYRPVCGFDGIGLMAYAGKQMYTIRQNFSRIGSEAVKELKKLMAGEPGSNVVLDYEVARIKYLDSII